MEEKSTPKGGAAKSLDIAPRKNGNPWGKNQQNIKVES